MPQTTFRPAAASDLEPLVALETRAMHFPMGHRVREWFRPDFPGDYRDHFMVAESSGELVSAAALLPVPLTYRGVPLKAAMWEAVVTDEAHRQKGLCRALFDRLERDAPYDLLIVQGLTWLYRRFGYHPGLRSHGGLDSARRTVRVSDLPETTLAVRSATPDDAPFLNQMREQAARRSIVASPASEDSWRWLLREDRTVAGPGETGLNRWQEWRLLVKDGEPIGAFAHDPWNLAHVMFLEVLPGTTYREAGATALRAAAEFAKTDEARVALPERHPLFAAFPQGFERRSRAYGDWAVKIPDLPGFLKEIAPAMEAKLAESAMAGWTGEITLSRIESGASVIFEHGRLVETRPWEGDRPDEARARFAPGRLEALLLGYRSIEETLREDPDCACDDEAQAILAALFPPGDSHFRPL